MASTVTPVRSLGERTSEGWILLRDVESTYRDGAEEALYDLVGSAEDISAESDSMISRARGWAERYHVDPDRSNIVRGLAIPDGARVLEIGSGCGAVTRYLGEVAATVDALEPVPARARVARERCRDLPGVEVFVGQIEDLPAEPTYDVVVVVGVLEYVGGGSADPAPYVDFLRAIETRLVPGGTLALAIENALGVKYLAGAPEDHTNRVFDSLEGYPYGTHARTFARTELESLMTAAGLTPRTLGVFPDYKMTRVVLDPEALATPPGGLIAQLPSFPSPDHLTPRAHLVDERSLWLTMCRAGLAAEAPNSFLVLAGKGGPSEIWPSSRAAIYHSIGRRAGFRTTSEVVIGEDGLTVHRRPRDPSGEAGARLTTVVEPVVPGTDFLDWAATADDAALGDALQEWVRLVEAAEARDGAVSPDLVPHNLIVWDDGALAVIDQEWLPSLTSARVVRRGVFWLAARLAMRTAPNRWTGETVGSVVAHLASLVGEVADGPWLSGVIDDESRIQAEVLVAPPGMSDEDFVADRAADLRRVLETRLVETPLGTRTPQELAVMIDELRREQEKGHKRAAEREELATALERAEHERAGAIAALEELRASRAFRAVAAYRRGLERMAPPASRRRAVYSVTGRAGVRVARSGLTAVRRLGGRAPVPGPAAAAAPARLATSDSPTVSVVVPVHGKWSFTAQCLRSFAEHPPTVPYELVVVDDASPDDTRGRLARVEGVRVVALDANQGFIGAVNAGIDASRGSFVVLLNNDTQITDGWLEALLETAQEPDVGLVGSKLVYPDGRLQEAGGIIFANAGGWNYGRFDDPNLQRYQIPRDVDYCSGAAIMVRKELLDELGGLDTDFAPAYYDDVDLAFSLRERGLRVVYQPRAVVIHHEGVSHGTDTSSGIKRYQEINRERLLAKWGERLQEHFPQDQGLVEAAARRTGTKGIVVVIDDHVPRPDEDSGSVRTFGLLTTLRTLGWSVIFVPDNRYHGDVWGERLREAGIEVFTGPEPLEGFLASLSRRVTAVVGARVTVAWPYLGLVRRVLPGVPFLFDTVDLHYLREAREAQLTGDVSQAQRAEATKRLELGFVTAADATLVVSPVEAAELAHEVPGATVCVVPNVHERRPEGPGPDGRSGMVFVGSFGHPPNVDAVKWLVTDILPLVRRELPDVVLRIVGKGAPQEVVELVEAAPGAELLGWLPTLDEVYATSRVSVAPLRYGAGVKGKVGEALSHGLPVVGTTMAVEGMHIEHAVSGWVADDAEQFAQGVVTLMRDDELWSRLSEVGREHVDRVLGTGRFERLVREALEAVGVD